MKRSSDVRPISKFRLPGHAGYFCAPAEMLKARTSTLLWFQLLLLAVLGCACAQLPALDEPEASTGLVEKRLQSAGKQMVASANPLASAAALAVLRSGGNAADAAIAAQWVLGLVEPQSSGIGGGLLLLYHDASSGQTIAIDGRETAPALANEDLFLDKQGRPRGFAQAVVGGRAVGTPGVVAGLAELHRRHGRLPWARLFDEAIELAEQGFRVSPRLNALLARETHLSLDPIAREYFYDNEGKARPVGHLLRNPEYAKTLRLIAAAGSTAFYRGVIAQDIASKVRSHPENPGLLSLADLDAYTAKIREPVCGPFMRFVVCGMPPPSSGGIALLQILGIWEALAGRRGPIFLTNNGQLEPAAVHRFSEAARLAFADRGQYLADPDFVNWPSGLLDGQYLAERARLIDESRSMRGAAAGNPRQTATTTSAFEASDYEERGTSHWSIADSGGNVVAVTSSIEDAFGSRQMVAGFLLNNQLTDFSWRAEHNGAAIANRVQAGKRPRSSMSPTIVFERQADGRPGAWMLSIGSAGGAQIINHVARVVLAVLAESSDIQAAINMPNFGSRNGPTELELGRLDATQLRRLRELGHELTQAPITSGLHGIVRQCTHRGKAASCTLFGGADPRREGLVLGD